MGIARKMRSIRVMYMDTTIRPPTNRKREVKHLKIAGQKLRDGWHFSVEVGRRLPQFILVDIQMSS